MTVALLLAALVCDSYDILDVYARVYSDLLAVPMIKGDDVASSNESRLQTP